MKVYFITSLAVGLGGSSLVSSKSNVSLLLSLNCNILVVLVSSSIPPLPLMVLLMTGAHRGPATLPLSHYNLQLSFRSLMVQLCPDFKFWLMILLDSGYHTDRNIHTGSTLQEIPAGIGQFSYSLKCRHYSILSGSKLFLDRPIFIRYLWFTITELSYRVNSFYVHKIEFSWTAVVWGLLPISGDLIRSK